MEAMDRRLASSACHADADIDEEKQREPRLLRLTPACFAVVCSFLPLSCKCRTLSAVCHELHGALLSPHCFRGDEWQLARPCRLPPPAQLPRFQSIVSLTVEEGKEWIGSAEAVAALRRLLLTCASSLRRLSLFQTVDEDPAAARRRDAGLLQLLISCPAAFSRLQRLELPCHWWVDSAWLQHLQALSLPAVQELSIGQRPHLPATADAMSAAALLPRSVPGSRGRVPAAEPTSVALAMAGLCVFISQHCWLQRLQVHLPLQWSLETLQAVLELPSLVSWLANDVKCALLSEAIDAVTAGARLPLLPSLESLALQVALEPPLHRRDGLLAVSRLLDQLQLLQSLTLATAGWEYRGQGEPQALAAELPDSIAHSVLSSCSRGLRRLALDPLLSLHLLQHCSHRWPLTELGSLCLVLQDWSAEQEQRLAVLLDGCSGRLTAVSVSLCGRNCFVSSLAVVACIAAHCPRVQRLAVAAAVRPVKLVDHSLRPPCVLPRPLPCLDEADVQRAIVSSGLGSCDCFRQLHTLSVFLHHDWPELSPATPESWRLLLCTPCLRRAPLTEISAPWLEKQQTEQEVEKERRQLEERWNQSSRRIPRCWGCWPRWLT